VPHAGRQLILRPQLGSTRLHFGLARTEHPAPHDRELLAAVERMHEQNPMLGLRGVRLGLAVPGLMAMQVRAVAEAVVFFPVYLEKDIFAVSPFETIDQEGVGRLVELAVEAGRAVNSRLETGVCGEHGGDPESIHFFHRVGLDYVSCSPFRIPAARLEAGRAALMDITGGSDSR
jgi:phosphoenolpyruvate synthase/pyruvate phosphate dikinase